VTRGALQKQLNDNGNALASLAVGILSVASEGADERTWRTLPGSIGVARLRLAMGEHRLALPTAQGVREFTLKIDRPHQVVPLRLVAGQVYAQGAATPTIPGVRAVASNQTP